MNTHALTDPDSHGVGSIHRLVEREEPLALACSAMAGAHRGSGSVVVFDGVAGVGKSSLLAAVREAAPSGIALLSATGHQLEGRYAFGVAVQLFESLLARASEAERARLLDGPAVAALRLFATHQPAAAADDSFSLLHGLWRLCANLAEPGGLAVLVDDAELADRASLRFLLYLAERLQEVPVALLLASGSAAPGHDRDLIERLEEHPAATRLRLQPLTERGTARHLRSAWFAGAGHDFCLAVYCATRGNPHLVRELAGTLWALDVEPDTAEAREVHLVAPPSIAAGALRHAGRAGPGGADLLRAAAVLGDGAEVRHAAHLAGLEAERALELSARLMQAGLLEEGNHLSFAQPVVRAAVAGNERPSRQAAANLRAARLLMDEEAPAERIVGHLLLTPGSGSGWAVDVLREAAACALAQGHPGTAVSYLRRALEEPPTADLHAQVGLELGRAEATAGEPEAVSRLLAAMERIEDRDQRAQTALTAGRTLFALGRHREAAATFWRGIEEIGDRDGELEAWLRSAHAAVSRLDPDAGTAEKAEAAAEGPQLALLAMEAALRGDPRERVRDLAVRALAGGALLEEETADGISFYLASAALALAEMLSLAEAGLTAALADARRRGSVLGFATASCFRSMAILRRGRLDDAAADARQAIAAERQGWRLAVPAARAVLAETLMDRGELEGAGKQLALAALAAPELHSGAIGLLGTRARMNLLSGAADRALEDFLACGSSLHAIGAVNPALSGWRSGAARASAVLGDSGEAIRLAEEELALAEAFGAPGPIGRALRALGALREGPARLDALEAAATTLEGSEAWLEWARALVDFGGALRRTGHRRAAREPLRRGLDLADRCGATALVGRALLETHAAGARPRRTAMLGLEALTARERQVASLAARGLSNREIAETLYVTRKTVEWHLHHSFEKLEIKSRGELAEVLGSEVPE